MNMKQPQSTDDKSNYFGTKSPDLDFQNIEITNQHTFTDFPGSTTYFTYNTSVSTYNYK